MLLVVLVLSALMVHLRELEAKLADASQGFPVGSNQGFQEIKDFERARLPVKSCF